MKAGKNQKAANFLRVHQFEPAESYKKRAFPNEDAVRKAFYLRIVELYKKWNGRPVTNWALVRNQLAMNDRIQARILNYERY